MRKVKKDFYDLYFLTKGLSFVEMVNAYREKYPYKSTKNVMMAISSCAVADTDEQPALLETVEWNKVKSSLINEVQQYEKDIIAQKENQIKERENNIRKLLQKKSGESG